MKLFNAHRLVSLRTNPPKRVLEAVPKHQQWRYKVTPDVARFVEETGLDYHNDRRKHFERVIENPSLYFSRPENVPFTQRQQIYLPEAVLTLIRTPNLPPRFASFWVPLWFNKLDMKDYLSRVYGVDVIHVRSFVQQQPLIRQQIPFRGATPTKPGRTMRPMSKKKMTVQLAEPFVWPEEVDDYSPWEKDSYMDSMKEREDRQNEMANETTETPEKVTTSIAEQAKAALRKGERWTPTWQRIPIGNGASGRPNPPP